MSESSGSTEPEQRVEREVENLISEAATLADDLSGELVGDDAAARETTDRERRFFESHATSEPDVEAQLSTAADQAADASNQLGGETSTQPGGDSTAELAAPPPADKSVGPGDEMTPTDEGYFATEPRPPVTRKAAKKLVLPPKGAKKHQDSAKTGGENPPGSGAATQVDTATENAVSFDKHDLADLDGNDANAATPGGHESASSSPANAPAATSEDPQALEESTAMPSGAVLALARVLELIDRPFARLGPTPRTLSGWCALILFVAAISLLIFVVF